MTNTDDTNISESVPGVVSVDVLASLFNLTTRRIQQLSSDGIIPTRNSRGEYLLAPSIRAYINFLQKDGVVDENLIAEKLSEEIENLKLKNKKLRMANERDENVLIYINDSREQMAVIAKTGLQVLETLPDILERDFGLDADIISGVEQKIDALREQWAALLEDVA